MILSEKQKQFLVNRNRAKSSQQSEDDNSAFSNNDKSESSRGLKLQVNGIDDTKGFQRLKIEVNEVSVQDKKSHYSSKRSSSIKTAFSMLS